MRFETDASDVNMPMLQAFANRHGVCQAFTRASAVLAGHMPGILRRKLPSGQPRLLGTDTMAAPRMLRNGSEMGLTASV